MLATNVAFQRRKEKEDIPNLPCIVRLTADNGDITIPRPHIIIIQTPSKLGLKLVVDSKLPITEMVIMGCTPRIEANMATRIKILPTSGVNSGTDKDIALLFTSTVIPVDITPAAKNKLNSRTIFGRSVLM